MTKAEDFISFLDFWKEHTEDFDVIKAVSRTF